MQAERIALSELPEAQRKMLLDAAARPRRNHRDNEANYAWVGKGQAGTAKKLEALGLGAYVSDGYSARFWIWALGYEVAAEAGVYPKGEGPDGGVS
jgi:hypothetical protein